MKRIFLSAALALLATSAPAQTKISELGAAGPLTGAEEVPIVQDGTTYKATTQDIADLATGTTVVNNVAFTPGCTGYAVCPITSNSAHYSITGNIACLNIQNFGGTSNATNFTITGLPGAIAPVNNGLQGPSGITLATNNATRVYAAFTIAGDGSGVISFRNGLASGTTTWTASGSKGLAEDFNVCYAIN